LSVRCRCCPCWVPLSTAGGLGAGAAAKLVANATLFDTLWALGEALALARVLGLSREVSYRVLAATPLAAQAARRRAAIETGGYPPRFPLSLARKKPGRTGNGRGRDPRDAGNGRLNTHDPHPPVCFIRTLRGWRALA
jgi:hypothetical protein